MRIYKVKNNCKEELMQTKLKTQERLWFYYFLQTNFYTSVFSSFALTHRKKKKNSASGIRVGRKQVYFLKENFSRFHYFNDFPPHPHRYITVYLSAHAQTTSNPLLKFLLWINIKQRPLN